MLSNSNITPLYDNDLVKNCDVKIYKNDSTPTLLLDKTHISNFTMSRVNYGFMEALPNDNTIIEVINWNDLSSSIRESLVKDAYIKITFSVGGYETTNCIIQCIDKIEVDYENFKAKITCISPFNKMTTYANAGVLFSGDLKTWPFKTNTAENCQHSGIGWGIGSKINPVSKTSSSTPNYSTFDLSDISNILPFNSKNLKKGIKRYDDPNDRSNVVVYGITTKEISVIFEYETYYYMGIIKFDGQYVVTGVSCQAEVNGQWVDVSAYISDIFSNCVDVYSSNTSYNHYKFKLYGYRANVEVPTDAEKYIRCYVWLDSQTAKLTPVQNVARAYYSNKEYYEFDCRLNPCIEPQDNIYVDGIGLLRVEELSLSFNGAFNGSIKARKFGDFSLQPVTISDLAYGTGYSFHINNPNDRPVYAYIWFYSDDDGKYVWTRKSIPANSYVHVTSTNTPTLTPRFNDATNKELETDVYVETIDQALPNLKADSYTYILYALSSPSISAIDYDDRGNFSFMVTNESKSSVTLYIIYSGQSATTLTFSISAGETITINNDNASQLFSSFYAKAYGELIDDVYCYFTITSTQQQSDNSIILRDDT